MKTLSPEKEKELIERAVKNLTKSAGYRFDVFMKDNYPEPSAHDCFVEETETRIQIVIRCENGQELARFHYDPFIDRMRRIKKPA